MDKKESVTKELELSDIYKPIGDQLVVEAKVNNKTEAGLHIPEHLQEKDWVVKVIAIGDKVEQIKKGDLVYCHFAGNTPLIPIMKRKDVEHLQIKEYQVLGIVANDYKVLTALENTKLKS